MTEEDYDNCSLVRQSELRLAFLNEVNLVVRVHTRQNVEVKARNKSRQQVVAPAKSPVSDIGPVSSYGTCVS
jgi:hypothetical protein